MRQFDMLDLCGLDRALYVRCSGLTGELLVFDISMFLISCRMKKNGELTLDAMRFEESTRRVLRSREWMESGWMACFLW